MAMFSFGKKKETPPSLPPGLPLEQVMVMKQRGMDNSQIISELERQGYSSSQIFDAINQMGISGGDAQFDRPQDINMQRDFSPQPYTYPQPKFEQPPQEEGMPLKDQIEEIAEAIVDEKWEELTKDVGNISLWKESVQTEVESVKQEILRLEGRLEKLQNAVLGKVEDYNKTLNEVNTEMQALSKVFEKIIEPLTTNIKELSRITSDLKNKK